MRDSAFIIVNKNGIVRLVKGRQSKHAKMTRPTLHAGEYAILISMVVPDRVFSPAPTPEATISVPENALIAPRVDVAIETFNDIGEGQSDAR